MPKVKINDRNLPSFRFSCQGVSPAPKCSWIRECCVAAAVIKTEFAIKDECPLQDIWLGILVDVIPISLNICDADQMESLANCATR